ncbi:alanyl-tRNA editing protein [Mesorhizobium sp. NBSH29]|uniref:alanyl-tRNA editing protein n=1 Tax=Mesorhizobium sp. NBSH29 TaxID=2654249 RepID=UPI0018967B55|nr:alanyl-tRNA editing protein [Mesorhizobium sp. NBSH29]
MATESLVRDDAYLREADATVIGVNERGGIILDRTIFYATSGGQPGDTGRFVVPSGEMLEIAATLTGETKSDIIHVPAPGQPLLAIGDSVKLAIDWDRRYRLMRMHSACHLLTVVCPHPITGASVAEDDSRVDFDMPDARVTKEDLTEAMMELVDADHPIFTRWISDAELSANPALVKSKNVRPPLGTGKIRLVMIGEEGGIDSQPCGGTHVARTGEIGEIHIGKIEKKGRENRRFRLRFGAMPRQ